MTKFNAEQFRNFQNENKEMALSIIVTPENNNIPLEGQTNSAPIITTPYIGPVYSEGPITPTPPTAPTTPTTPPTTAPTATATATDEEEVLNIKEIEVRGNSGLTNIGNTCYMNSTLQCLLQTKLLLKYLVKKEFYTELINNATEELAKNKRRALKLDENTMVNIVQDEIREKGVNTITYQLSVLFEKMWEGNRPIRPVAFKKILGETCDTFANFGQHDSQEVLNIIIDNIHEETKTTSSVSIREIPDAVMDFYRFKTLYNKKIGDSTISVEDKALIFEQYKEYRTENLSLDILCQALIFEKKNLESTYSIISEFFTGLFYSQLKCHHCSDVSFKFEQFNSLSTEIPEGNDIHLEQCLKSFSKEETLSETDKYKCDGCKLMTTGVKSMKIWKTPQILIIHLKRFRHVVHQNRVSMEKNNSLVKFPFVNLDLKDNYHELNKPKEPNNVTYNLYAVIHHRGQFGGGHYVAYCKNAISGLWYEFDDSTVSYIPAKYVEEIISTNNAYVLFYEKNII